MIIEQQSIPTAQVFSISEKNNHPNNDNNIGKLSIIPFDVDQSTSKVNFSKLGSKTILAREDIKSDLINIKNSLNENGVPFSCDFIDIKLKNDNISHMAKLGLEINLNLHSGMTKKSDLYNDDYFIGPDFNKPYGNGYRLKVYGQCRKSNPNKESIYKQMLGPVHVYDIRQTYGFGEPKLKKIFKPLIDITKIFEDHGFKQPPPAREFIYRSNNIFSNWFVFYKPNKINVGDTYIEHLSKIYNKKNEPIWQNKHLKWDGEAFNG